MSLILMHMYTQVTGLTGYKLKVVIITQQCGSEIGNGKLDLMERLVRLGMRGL